MAERDRAIRQMQGALRSAPYYDGTGLWSTFSFEWKNWCPLAWTGGNEDLITAVEKKRILVTRIRGQAVARLKAYGEGSQAWDDAATLAQYLDVVKSIYQPAAESDLARAEFNSRKQGENETILDYLTSKMGLFDSAYPEAERSFTLLMDQIIAGIWNSEIKFSTQRNRPEDRAAVVPQLLRDVAAERACVLGGYGRSATLGGLALSSQGYTPGVTGNRHGAVPGYDQFGDEYMDVGALKGRKPPQKRGPGSKGQKSGQKEQRKCYRCHKQGHLRTDCRVPENKLPKKSPGKQPTGQQQQKTCYNCQGSGHFASQCKRPRRQRQGIHGLTEETDPAEAAVVDPFLDDSDE